MPKRIEIDQLKELLAGTGLDQWLGRMRVRPSMLATQRPESLRSAA